jgi:hypothetical protein
LGLHLDYGPDLQLERQLRRIPSYEILEQHHDLRAGDGYDTPDSFFFVRRPKIVTRFFVQGPFNPRAKVRRDDGMILASLSEVEGFGIDWIFALKSHGMVPFKGLSNEDTQTGGARYGRFGRFVEAGI